jgi:hypothetical protein
MIAGIQRDLGFPPMSVDRTVRHVLHVDRLVAGGSADALDEQDHRSRDRQEPPSYAVRFRQHTASRTFNDLGVLAAWWCISNAWQ